MVKINYRTPNNKRIEGAYIWRKEVRSVLMSERATRQDDPSPRTSFGIFTSRSFTRAKPLRLVIVAELSICLQILSVVHPVGFLR